MSPSEDPAAPVRVDKWLWAARLLKTRSLAAEAVKGGRVHVNGQAIKPSRELRPGDRVELSTGPYRRTVDVRATTTRRGPAPEAERLYAETPESRAAREREAEQRRDADPRGQPRHERHRADAGDARHRGVDPDQRARRAAPLQLDRQERDRQAQPDADDGDAGHRRRDRRHILRADPAPSRVLQFLLVHRATRSRRP